MPEILKNISRATTRRLNIFLQKENRHLLVLAIILCCLFILASVETSLGLFSTSSSFTVNPKVIGNFHGIQINSTLSGISAQDQYAFRLHFSFVPTGDLVDTENSWKMTKILSREVSLSIDSQLQTYGKGSVMTSFDLILPFQYGNPDAYPFDTYEASFFVDAATLVSTNKTAVPLSMSLGNNLQDWSADIDITAVADDYSLLQVILITRRAPLQRFFSLFIVTTMWMISLAIFIMAYCHFLWKKTVTAPTIGVATTMLFALPAIRNSQPGAPPIGCTSDVVGFFFNMFFVAAASLMLIYKVHTDISSSFFIISNIYTYLVFYAIKPIPLS